MQPTIVLFSLFFFFCIFSYDTQRILIPRITPLLNHPLIHLIHPIPNSLLLLYMQIQAGSFLYRKPIYIRRGDSQYMRVACVHVCVCRILIHTHAYRYTRYRPNQLLSSKVRVEMGEVCAGRLDARMTPLLLRFSHVWIFPGDM